ncbi:MAG TPA: hypothetical protein VF606_04100, partial [Geminicoccaceae bacterium]
MIDADDLHLVPALRQQPGEQERAVEAVGGAVGEGAVDVAQGAAVVDCPDVLADPAVQGGGRRVADLRQHRGRVRTRVRQLRLLALDVGHHRCHGVAGGRGGLLCERPVAEHGDRGRDHDPRGPVLRFSRHDHVSSPQPADP